jgi:glycosyltransferase involved in cell wall biosynthesis
VEVLRSNFKRGLYKAVFKNSEVIQLAEVLYDDISEIYPSKPYYLPNGIVEVNPNLLENDSEAGCTTFIYLSNLMEEKGILLFLDSIRDLQEISTKFKVYIVGPSADVSLQQLKDYISVENITNVEIVGPVYNDDKYAFFRKSDVFVLPTFYKNECFPLTILEAYQAGLVVLSTDNGAIPSMVQNKVNGFLIPQKNGAELTKMMKNLIENPDLQAVIKKNNRVDFQEKYTEDIFIDNFIAIIDDILTKQ